MGIEAWQRRVRRVGLLLAGGGLFVLAGPGGPHPASDQGVSQASAPAAPVGAPGTRLKGKGYCRKVGGVQVCRLGPWRPIRK